VTVGVAPGNLPAKALNKSRSTFIFFCLGALRSFGLQYLLRPRGRVVIVSPCNDTLCLKVYRHIVTSDVLLGFGSSNVLQRKTEHCKLQGNLHGSGAVGKLTD